MSKNKLSVAINKGSPNKMIHLGETIVRQHHKMGNSSPLTGLVDMNTFSELLTFATDKQKLAFDNHANGEAYIQAANSAMGIESNQRINTEGTVYYFIGRIKRLLLMAYINREDEISTFGFNVVVSTRGKKRNIKAPIPVSKAMTTLAKKIISRHQELSNDSPLNGIIDMPAFESVVQEAINNREMGNSFHAKGEAAKQASNTALGIADGQTIFTEGTVYNLISRIRTILLLVYQGIEEQLNRWGFHVVVGRAKSKKDSTPENDTTEETT